MKISFECFTPDENSTEMKDLYLRGVFVGQYSFGLWSKWYNLYWEKKNEPSPDMENYICGKLHNELCMDVRTAEDVKRVEKYCKALKGMTLIEYAVSVMETEIKEFHDN